MKYKKSKTSSFYLIVIIIIFVFFLGFYLLKNNIFNITKYISYPCIYIKQIINNNNLLKSKNKLEIENMVLKEKINEYKSLDSDITYLKDMLSLKNTYNTFNIYSATIILYDNNFNDTLVIDKGVKDGIDKNMAVISNNGLIGLIKDTFYDTSYVKLIKDIKFTVKIENDKGVSYGVIDGFYKDYLILKDITDKSIIKENDKVLTTGYGVIPKDIYVGKIKVFDDKIYVTCQNLKDIYYVSIIGNKFND